MLGPVEVLAGGTPVPLGGAKRRTLLAMLVLNANEPVPTAALIDALWADDPPKSAGANVRTYLAGLRRALLEFGLASRLETTDGRVLLRLATGESDVTRFEALVDQASEADDLELASRWLGEAIGLWRGQVGAGLSYGPILAQDAVRLEDLRVSAVERYADLQVALGRHDLAIRELRRVLAAHPFREKAWGQLMRALWQRGDGVAALETYRQARALFVAELGVEPSAQLRELHQAVLCEDVKPDARGSRPPREIPPRLPKFVGREAELTRLTALLCRDRSDGSPAVVVIHGLAGVGKSALAVEAVYRVATKFPGGCLHVDLRGSAWSPPVPSDAVLGRVLRALGGSDDGCADTDEASARFRSLTAGRRLLLVLDDAAGSGQVRPLLPAGSGCGVLITSRRRLASLDHAYHLELTGLSRSESLTLFQELIGHDRMRADPGAAASIVDRCARLPLAIRVIAGRFQARPGWTLQQVAERLADSARRLDELRNEDFAVRSSFELSYRALLADDERAAMAFQLLGFAELSTLTGAAAAALFGCTSTASDAILERLVDGHLLEEGRDGRFGMHDLLRLYAGERAAADLSASQRHEAVLRLLSWYLAGLRANGLTAGRFRDSTWLTQECGNLLALVRAHAHAPGSAAALVLSIVDELVPYLDFCRPRRDLLDVGAIAVEVADRRGEPESMARTRLYLARAHLTAGRPDEAARWARASRRLFGRAGDPLGEAKALNYVGLVHRRRGEFEAAVACLERVVRIRRRSRDQRGQSAALDNLGLAYFEAGATAKAMACQASSRAIARELGDRHLEGLCLLNLANLQRQTGQITDAIEHYEQAAGICRQFGNQRGEAVALQGLGVGLQAAGEHERARACLRQAVTIFERLGLPQASAIRADLARS